MSTSPKKLSRTLTVAGIQQISKNLRRITLSGDDLASFPANETGGYVKFMFHDEQYVNPLVRTYTVRNTRLQDLEIDVDFALHEHGGPAAQWAMTAQLGAEIQVGGPGPKKNVELDADWYLLIGDMTALPAISVNLEYLAEQRPDAKGYAILEIVSEDDIHDLVKPQDIEVKWIVNPKPGEQPELLLDAARSINWLDGKVGVWTACEFSSMKQFRQFYLKEKQLNRKEIYISSYWKHGVSEDEHKRVKREDALASQ
jgi:NADPH-dependent ferric siderophore reductase